MLATMVAGFSYMLLFNDELDPKNPANQAAGLLAPMNRHWVEYFIIVATTWPAVGYLFYRVFGNQYEIAVLKRACKSLFFLHVVSGLLVFAGVCLALAFGQPLQWRDAFTGLTSALLIATGWSERRYQQQTLDVQSPRSRWRTSASS